MAGRIVTIAGALGVVLFVSGCVGGTVEQAWQCPINQGRGCQTITQADNGIYGAPGKLGARVLGRSVNSTPVRTQEVIGTIYFYPFIDSKGNYHQGDVIYKVFVPAKWSKQQ